MNYLRVCLIVIVATTLSVFLVLGYMNNLILKNLSVEHAPIPSLNADQIRLYKIVFKGFLDEVHCPNRAYIKEIYESDNGDIIVHIEYFGENYSLMYYNGKIIKTYAIQDQVLPCYYVFDQNGMLLRKE
jgi:hypothetical protein